MINRLRDAAHWNRPSQASCTQGPHPQCSWSPRPGRALLPSLFQDLPSKDWPNQPPSNPPQPPDMMSEDGHLPQGRTNTTHDQHYRFNFTFSDPFNYSTTEHHTMKLWSYRETIVSQDNTSSYLISAKIGVAWAQPHLGRLVADNFHIDHVSFF